MKLSRFQKVMLINAQPVKFWLNLVGGVIALYLLWAHKLAAALLSGGFFILAGTYHAKRYSRLKHEEVAQTRLGHIFLQYSTPFGFVCYLASHVLIPVSFWFHQWMVAGAGMVLLGIGLIKVNKKTPWK
jgi:hypothetical protein